MRMEVASFGAKNCWDSPCFTEGFHKLCCRGSARHCPASRGALRVMQRSHLSWKERNAVRSWIARIGKHYVLAWKIQQSDWLVPDLLRAQMDLPGTPPHPDMPKDNKCCRIWALWQAGFGAGAVLGSVCCFLERALLCLLQVPRSRGGQFYPMGAGGGPWGVSTSGCSASVLACINDRSATWTLRTLPSVLMVQARSEKMAGRWHCYGWPVLLHASRISMYLPIKKSLGSKPGVG